MDVIIATAIIAAVVGLAIGIVAGYFTRKNISEAKIGEADSLAKNIIDQANKDAETIKKEKLLEENFIKRCADTFADERGLVIPLEDSDLIKALEDYPNMGVDAIENILASKYEQIVFEK